MAFIRNFFFWNSIEKAQEEWRLLGIAEDDCWTTGVEVKIHPNRSCLPVTVTELFLF